GARDPPSESRGHGRPSPPAIQYGGGPLMLSTLMGSSIYNRGQEARLRGHTASHLTAGEAARTLGIRLPTLYAYASRGMLRSEPGPGEPRARRYAPEDIERLLARPDLRRHPPRGAAEGPPFCPPLPPSSPTPTPTL